MEYSSYEEQDIADSESIYNILENKIIPIYYNMNKSGYSEEWIDYMKNSIISTGGEYSTSRMLVDYTKKLYMPLCNLTHKYYENLENVTEFEKIKEDLSRNWEDIVIMQNNNLDNISIDAGNNIDVTCTVKLPNINIENVAAESYYGVISDNGTVEDINVIPMNLVSRDDDKKEYTFATKILLKSGGNYGYTFRVMPKHEMLLDSENLNLVKWITK